MRELDEEFALRGDLPAPADVRLLGYARASYTGGKPQFYGVARTISLSPRNTDTYVEGVRALNFDPLDGAPGWIGVLEKFRREESSHVAPPLVLVIEMLKSYLEAEPDAARWLLFQA